MIFRKKYELTIQELEERILQLEKRLEEYRKEEKKAVKEITTLVRSINENMNVTFINLQKQLKKSEKLSEEKKYEILEEWKIQQGSDKE